MTPILSKKLRKKLTDESYGCRGDLRIVQYDTKYLIYDQYMDVVTCNYKGRDIFIKISYIDKPNLVNGTSSVYTDDGIKTHSVIHKYNDVSVEDVIFDIISVIIVHFQ